MTTKNTGKPYEALTEAVFTRLLAQQKLVDLARDTKIAGKSGTSHQIDVSFSFDVAGTRYLTIIQCKDWASAVKQEQVLAFHGVLGDIAGQPRGIMVSRSGFQEGARTFADHHGIQLYELREPKDEDWDGLIQTIEMTANLDVPEFRNTRCNPHEAWVKAQLVEHNLKGITFNASNAGVIPGVTKATFESGADCNLRTVLNGHLPAEPCDWTPITWEPPEPLYIEAPKVPFGRIRIATITSEARITRHSELWTFKLDHLVAYCFKDVLAGTSQFLDDQGSPLGSDEADASGLNRR